MTNQLTLALLLQDDTTFANFYPGKNHQVVAALQELSRGRGEQLVYLWGQQGVGRTHLLQACCHVADKLKLAPIYLPLSRSDQLRPEMFEGLEALHVACVDDIEGIIGKSEWEESFFHFFNRMREAGKRIIVSARLPPNELGLKLPDLVSRLNSGVSFQVFSLNDEDKCQALLLRAKGRGLHVPDAVAQYLIRHWPRDMRSLFEAVEKLDHASLVAKRKLTVPFVKEVLGI